MEEDEDLERIKMKKLREMLKRGGIRDESRTHYRERALTLNRPIIVTDTTFDEVIKSRPLVVVDCWAPWCGPCHMIAPIIEELASEYGEKILFGKLNVDENRKVPVKYQVMSIPTLLVFKNGRLVDRIIGVMSRGALEQRITRYV